MSQTLETQARIYDDFAGPDLDMSKWMYLEYPIPEGPSWRCTEPNARIEVEDGTFSVHVDQFEQSHDAVQIIDNPKFLVLSTESFRLPESGVATFSVLMAVTGINGERHDYRDGVAAFNVLDLETGFVFDVAANSDHIWAIHEMLPLPTAAADPFTHMTENPFSPARTSAGQTLLCQVRIDTATSTITWLADGHPITQVQARQLPVEVRVGLGLFTLHPIIEGRSQSLRGQGISASWSGVSIQIDTP